MPLCQEVQCFVIACEVIQSIFAGGGTLTEDELGVLMLETEELREKLLERVGGDAV